MADPRAYRPPLAFNLERQVRAGLRDNLLTQAMLARRVGATEKHVSRVLNGHDDGSIPFWDALLREAWRAREEGEPGNRLSPDSAEVDYVALCGCGCRRPRAEVVREVARDMLLNEDQADSIVPTAANSEAGESHG